MVYNLILCDSFNFDSPTLIFVILLILILQNS